MALSIKKTFVIAGVVVAAIVLLLPAFAWLIGREAALPLVARIAESFVNVEIGNASGSLYGPLRMDHLRYENESVVIELTDVVVDWNPRALVRREFRINGLQAGELRVQPKTARNAAQQSGTGVRFPVNVEVESFTLGRVEVGLPQPVFLTRVAGHANIRREQDFSVLEVAGNANYDQLAADARFALDSSRGYRVGMNLSGFNLASVGALPTSDISGTLLAEGSLKPGWSSKVEFKLGASRINDYPLSGKGELRADPERIDRANVALRVGDNQLSLQGALGSVDDVLSWRVDAPALAQLGAGFRGRVRSNGTVRGTFAQPSLQATLDARKVLLFGRHVIGHAQANAKVGGAGERLEASALVERYAVGGFAVEKADVKVSGTVAEHNIALSLRNRLLNTRATVRGGFNRAVWDGRLLSLDNGGAYPMSLQGQARIAVSREHASIRDATLRTGAGKVSVTVLEKRGRLVRFVGRVRGFALSYLQALSPDAWPVKSTLTLSGDWDLRADDHLNGNINFNRESGDVVLLNATPPQALGLGTMSARIALDNDEVAAQATVTGALPGHIDARVKTVLSQRDDAWGIAQSAPLSLSADARVPSLAWLGVFMRDRAAVKGRLDLQASANGTLANPRWRGEARGENLELRLPEYGLNWGNGVLTARFIDERLMVEELRLHGGDGVIEASGYLDVLKPTGVFDVTANNLQVVRTPLRDIVAGGKGKIQLRGQRFDITGQVKVERALIKSATRPEPIRSSDIVIVGQEEAARPGRGRALNAQLDVFIDLGSESDSLFYVKASGLDARLGGALRVRANEAGLPQASGTIRVIEGRYSAYGQTLTVTRGLLNFSGPIDNPALDILATRKIANAGSPATSSGSGPTSATSSQAVISQEQTVEVGVAVGGTALAPVVHLFSDPGMPDSEKLSWLVLGHGLGQATSAEFDVLGAAAGALLEQGESVSLQASIARQAGLDELRLKGGGGLEGAIVTLGKQISSDIYLSYERSVTGTTNVTRLRYALSPKWSVQTEAGSTGSGQSGTAVDLFYTLSFD